MPRGRGWFARTLAQCVAIATLGITLALSFGAANASENELKRVRETLLADSKDRVVLFSAPWCALCKAAKFHFKTQSIPFVEYDVEAGLENMVRFHAFGQGGLPLILVKSEPLRGFSIDAFEEIWHPQPVAAEPPPLAAQKVAPRARTKK